MWALYNFATRNVIDRYPTPVGLYYQARVGALVFLPLAVSEHRNWRAFDHPTATIGCLIALAVLCSIAGLGLYAEGLQRLRPSTAVNLLNLVPVFGLAISAHRARRSRHGRADYRRSRRDCRCRHLHP